MTPKRRAKAAPVAAAAAAAAQKNRKSPLSSPLSGANSVVMDSTAVNNQPLPRKKKRQSGKMDDRLNGDRLNGALPSSSPTVAVEEDAASRVGDMSEPSSPAGNDEVEVNGDQPDSPSPAGTPPPPAAVNGAEPDAKPINTVNVDPRSLTFPASAMAALPNYDEAHLEAITLRQLEADVEAYQHDLDFCSYQLSQAVALDLSPNEARGLQLRILDLSHQLRTCRHRIELTNFRGPASARDGGRSRGWGYVPSAPAPVLNGTPAAANAAAASSTTLAAGSVNGKKRRASPAEDDDTTPNKLSRPVKRTRLPSESPRASAAPADADPGGTAQASIAYRHAWTDAGGPPRTEKIQRLGEWHCRLCASKKYQLAKATRTPAMPCKWALRDTAKTIAHYTEMHTEHTPEERCAELGSALEHNAGPFEYWLRVTRGADVGEDGELVGSITQALRAGGMPDDLRRLSRAASNFPLTGR